MFGLYSNSRAPIATLPNVAYTLSITEDITLEAFSAEGEAYIASIIEGFSLSDPVSVNQAALFSTTENVQLNDTFSITAQFNSLLTENFTLGDASVTSASFLSSLSENFLIDSSQVAAASFVAQTVESIELNDIISYFKYPVDEDWAPINTDIYTYSASELMFGAASFAQITFSGYVGGPTIVNPNWVGGSQCAYETVPVYTYIPINPEGAIFGSGTFAGFTFGGFSGVYEVITTYEIIGPVNTDVVWDAINTDIYTITGVSVAAVGALPFSGAAISSSSGGTAIVTPNWTDIVNS